MDGLKDAALAVTLGVEMLGLKQYQERAPQVPFKLKGPGQYIVTMARTGQLNDVWGEYSYVVHASMYTNFDFIPF